MKRTFGEGIPPSESPALKVKKDTKDDVFYVKKRTRTTFGQYQQKMLAMVETTQSALAGYSTLTVMCVMNEDTSPGNGVRSISQF